MPNANPQAVKWANERARPLCDRLAQGYHFINAILKQVEAEGIDKLFAEDKEPVKDGSENDGRTPITNEDIKALLGAMNTYRDFLDGQPEMRDLILRVAVNPLHF